MNTSLPFMQKILLESINDLGKRQERFEILTSNVRSQEILHKQETKIQAYCFKAYPLTDRNTKYEPFILIRFNYNGDKGVLK